MPDKHIDILRQAIINRDFATFADIVAKESNQLHAVCMDSVPAIFYMNSTSRNIIGRIKELNQSAKETIATYSIDAGFHVFVFTMVQNV